MENNIILIGKLLSERYILPKHLGISSRKVSYWKERIILPFFTKDKHAKMNITEAVWLFVVNELTIIGVDSKRLEALAEDVWDKPRKEGYLDKKLDKLMASNDSKKAGTVDLYKALKKDKILITTLEQETNPFSDSVLESVLIKKNPISLFYFPSTGEHHFSTGDKELPLKLLNLTNEVTFICIPIMPFVKTIVSVEFNMVQKEFSYLSEIENQIKDIVLYKAPKYIELVVDRENIAPLVIREQHKGAKQLADFILNNKLPKSSKLLIEPRSQDNYKLTLITR
jgi:hypothetical protein